MKRPNILLEKKYLSSLVIAAFLILSVLTAYNIRSGPQGPEEANTEVEETLGDREGVRNEGTPDSEATSNAEEEETTGLTGSSTEEKTETKEETTAARGGREEKFHYDGEEKLPWPVMGSVILPYSMDTTVYYTTLDQYACNEGVLIGAGKGEKVKAAAPGRVVNIFDSDKYGRMVTVLIGDYYEMYYGQLENVNYEVGDELEAGEVIGTVAEPSRAFNLEGPHLFLKMTWKGEPVNPTDYLES